MTFRAKAAAAFVAFSVVGAACGDDDAGDSAGETASTVEGSAVPTGADQSTATTDGGGTTVATASEETGAGGSGSGEGCTEEQAGGSLTFGAFSEPAGLDPIQALGSGGVGGIELTNLLDTLMRYDAESGEFEAHLAESVEPNDDFSEWTVTLRDGIAFSNGDPLDAEVVKASVERHFTDANTTTSRLDVATTIDEITVVDPSTVRFTLIDPWQGFPFLLSTRVGMITNPTAVEAAGEAFGVEVPPETGVGPYELVRFAPGEEIVMRAKDDYWGGPVCIEELRFTVVETGAATYEAFRNDDFQAFIVIDPPTAAEAKADGVEGHGDLMQADVMLINNGLGDEQRPAEDVRVRQAIGAAFDPEVVNDRVFEGTAFATGALLAEDTQRDVELSGPEFDPDRATELVEEVKAETGWDGTLEMVCSPGIQELCIATKAMLDAVGFNVVMDNLATSSDFQQRVVVAQDFDIARWSMTIAEAVPWRGLSQLHSESASNRSGYSDPEMDAALAELKTAQSVEEENELLEQIQEIWNETVPMAKYATGEQFIGWADNVEGIVPIGDGMVSFADAYLTD